MERTEDAAPDLEGTMILGLSIANFTVLHVVISMLAIFSGFIVLGAMFSGASLGGWTVFFLLMTILTSLTGFMFPFATVTPAIVVGVIASLILVIALWALYGRGLAGGWRVAYVVAAVASLYLNVFVLIAQGFQKVSFLNPYAPTGSEPPFLIAQVAALVVFVILGVIAVNSFKPNRLAV